MDIQYLKQHSGIESDVSLVHFTMNTKRQSQASHCPKNGELISTLLIYTEVKITY